MSALNQRQRALLEACVEVVDERRLDGFVPVGGQYQTMESLVVRGLVEPAGMMTSEDAPDDRERRAYVPTTAGRDLVKAGGK